MVEVKLAPNTNRNFLKVCNNFEFNYFHFIMSEKLKDFIAKTKGLKIKNNLQNVAFINCIFKFNYIKTLFTWRVS